MSRIKYTVLLFALALTAAVVLTASSASAQSHHDQMRPHWYYDFHATMGPRHRGANPVSRGEERGNIILTYKRHLLKKTSKARVDVVFPQQKFLRTSRFGTVPRHIAIYRHGHHLWWFLPGGSGDRSVEIYVATRIKPAASGKVCDRLTIRMHGQTADYSPVCQTVEE